MNETEYLEDELFNYGYNLGTIWGEQLSLMFANVPIPDKPVIVKLPLEQLLNFQNQNFSARTSLLMKIGSETVGMGGNSVIAGSAVITCGLSSIGLTSTNNPLAQTYFALSCAFSTTSAATSGMAVLARKCEISEVGLLTETLGGAFLYLGHKAHAAALKAESKPVPRRFRRPLSSYGIYRGNNAAFVMPYRYSAIIEAIPFEQIGRGIGFTLSIYCYGKIIVSGYRYGQKLIVKYKKKKLFKSAKLFTTLIYIRPALCRRRRLNHFVFQSKFHLRL